MNTADEFLARVAAFAARHAMWAPGQRVLAAVSGGVDSMALLEALRALGAEVAVAHFDHETRGGASAADAAFVAEQCAALGLACRVGRWREWAGAAAAGSFEMEARARRYAFLAAAAREAGCTVIATGHHADDQAETVLMRVLRGTGPGGLAGIPPVREEAGARIVRPLLAEARAAIRAWAAAQGLAWREDASNADNAHTRNRVRHELLPRLREEFNPNVDAALAHLAESAQTDDTLLRALAAEAEGAAVRGGVITRAAFAALHPALQRRVLLRWLAANGGAAEHAGLLRTLEFVLAATPGERHSAGGGVLLHATRDEVMLAGEEHGAAGEAALPVPGACVYGGHRFIAHAPGPPPAAVAAQCTPARQWFDADRLGARLTVRGRRDGDTFVPLGMTGTRKLQDYLVDRHVPRPGRDAVPLLLARGEIAWVVGHAPGAHFAVTDATRAAVCVEVSDDA